MGKALTIRRLGENFRSAGIDLLRLGQSPRPIPAMLEIPGKTVLRIGEMAWSCNVWATYRTMVTVRFPLGGPDGVRFISEVHCYHIVPGVKKPSRGIQRAGLSNRCGLPVWAGRFSAWVRSSWSPS